MASLRRRLLLSYLPDLPYTRDARYFSIPPRGCLFSISRFTFIVSCVHIVLSTNIRRFCQARTDTSEAVQTGSLPETATGTTSETLPFESPSQPPGDRKANPRPMNRRTDGMAPGCKLLCHTYANATEVYGGATTVTVRPTGGIYTRPCATTMVLIDQSIVTSPTS